MDKTRQQRRLKVGGGGGWSGAPGGLSTEARAALGVWAPKPFQVPASGPSPLPCLGPPFPKCCPARACWGSPGPDPVSSGGFLLSPPPVPVLPISLPRHAHPRSGGNRLSPAQCSSATATPAARILPSCHLPASLPPPRPAGVAGAALETAANRARPRLRSGGGAPLRGRGQRGSVPCPAEGVVLVITAFKDGELWG